MKQALALGFYPVSYEAFLEWKKEKEQWKDDIAPASNIPTRA
jgi:hypothetical protein